MTVTVFLLRPLMPGRARFPTGGHSRREPVSTPAGPSLRQVTQCCRNASDLKPPGCRAGGVLERLRQAARASEATVGDLDAPGLPDGAENWLLVGPPNPADLDVVALAERACTSFGHAAVNQHQFETACDARPVQVLRHQLAGAVLVHGGGDHQRTYRETGG